MTSTEQALFQRRSVRGFLPAPVPEETIKDILRAARTAPSGANLQPGRFHVLTGSALALLSEELLNAIAKGQPEVSEYSYFPEKMNAALKSRQRAAGYALYQALGIERRDIAGRKAQFDLNYRFFNAPVGIVVTIDRDMGKGCFMDLGMSLMALMLAAQSRGLATCGVGALAKRGDVVHQSLVLPGNELVVCGMALGWPDPDASVNQVQTERLPLDEYSNFYGF